jgi:hypothetical protein
VQATAHPQFDFLALLTLIMYMIWASIVVLAIKEKMCYDLFMKKTMHTKYALIGLIGIVLHPTSAQAMQKQFGIGKEMEILTREIRRGQEILNLQHALANTTKDKQLRDALLEDAQSLFVAIEPRKERLKQLQRRTR